MHKFNPANIDRLESPERRQKLPPDKVIDKIRISGGDTVVDIGCGTGYFTIPLSVKAGDEGTVYAVDISGRMLKYLNGKITGIKNIVPVLSEENEFRIKEKSADVIFMAFILHEVVDKKVFLSKAVKLLKGKGQAIVIDWQKKETVSGPPVEDRLGIEEVKELFFNYRFSLIKEIPQHEDIYFLVFEADKH